MTPAAEPGPGTYLARTRAGTAAVIGWGLKGVALKSDPRCAYSTVSSAGAPDETVRMKAPACRQAGKPRASVTRVPMKSNVRAFAHRTERELPSTERGSAINTSQPRDALFIEANATAIRRAGTGQRYTDVRSRSILF